MTALKTDDDFAKSWQQLLIMYQSRYEKRLAWKEKSEDFQKIEKALVEQQQELDEIERKLPKPIKIKKKKEPPAKPRSKQAVVCVLDLENKTAEPFGNHPLDDDDDDEEKANEPMGPMVDAPIPTRESEDELRSIAVDTKGGAVINDPFFLNSQHQITYQKRTSRNKDDADTDDKSFIEHSYFINALSSSSNRRDGGGEIAKRKWAHLSPLTRTRPSTHKSLTSENSQGTGKCTCVH